MTSLRPLAALAGVFIIFPQVSLPLHAANITRSAEFIINQTIAQTNPPGFGAEYVQQQRINNWTSNPGMEPLQAYRYWEASGGGIDATGAYVVCSTRSYDTTSSGFFDGGRYRIYREVTNIGTGKIEIQKIREGTIPAGGYVAAGYEELPYPGLTPGAPATNVVDDLRLTNGVTWYYAVKATDAKGNVSSYSPAIVGVTPANGINNGPRIKTWSVANPTLGTAYTIAAPLLRLAALGGTAPLRWSIASGALPTGISMDNTGTVYGTCTSTNPAPFAVRVVDASSRTDEHAYIMFRQKPAGDSAIPAAPSNVVVEANDGFAYVRWSPSPDADIDFYRVYRSRWPASQHLERIYLGAGGPLVTNGDLVFVERTWTNAPPEETRSTRVTILQSELVWSLSGTGAKGEMVPHPGPLPVAFSNDNPGVSCLKLSTTGTVEFGIWIFKYGGTNDSYWSVAQLPTGRTYRMECWVRGDGIASNIVRLYMPQYANVTVTGVVNGAWTKLSASFFVSNWITSSISISGPQFLFRGPGTVYVDNAVVYCADEPRGACHLTKAIYDMWLAYLGPSNRTAKGALRTRYMSETFDHVMNPAVMSRRTWDVNYGGTAEDPMHIHDSLQASYESGTTPETRTVPWITANLNWQEQDYVNLVEYLCGPAGTPYGNVRIAQRGGITTPWINEFRAVYLEMGNEPWNTGYFFGFRGGFSEASGRTYGRWCKYIWDYVQANSAYYSSKIKVSLGGWAAALTSNSFSGAALEECPLASRLGLTSYLGGWEVGQGGQVGGTIWSEEGVQQWMVFNEYSGRNYIDKIATFQMTMAARGLPFDVMMYEGGPSYLMSGLNGVSLTAQEQEVARNYGRTLAAGVGTLDFWLYGAYRGIKEQEFFTYGQDQGLWCSHTYVWNGYRPHPSWLALQMINTYVSDAAMLVTAAQNVPTMDLAYSNTTPQVAPNLALASVYAYRTGSTYNVCAINKKLDGTHNGVNFGDGCTPMTLHLPFTNAASIMLYKIEGDPRETNRRQMNFQIVTQAISTTYFSKDFVVNANTGGRTNGITPGGIYLYVFKGCAASALSSNPAVVINQAPWQDDPTLNTGVQFRAVFDQAVFGFTASDIALTGTAGATSVVVADVPGSQRLAYDVTVQGMQQRGTVVVTIPANAATNAAGYGNLASTSSDNVVTYDPITPPDTPANLSPADGALNQPVTLTLQASAFSDPNIGDYHTASQWQMSTDRAFTALTWDSGTDTLHLTGVATPTLGYATRYYWRVRYADSTNKWSAYSTPTWFETTFDPNGPYTPTNRSPVNSATGVAVSPRLSASAFADPNPGNTHAASQWQISEFGTFAPLVWDSGQDTAHLTNVAAPPTFYNTRYYWRVRYKDNTGIWSVYSSPTWFETISVPGTNVTGSGVQINWRDTASDFNAGASWQGGMVPGTNEIAAFTNTSALANAPQLTAAASVKGLQIGAGPVTFADPSNAVRLTLGNAGIAAGAGSVVIPAGNMGLTLGADQDWNIPGQFTINNDVNGAATLTKRGVGTNAIIGANGALSQISNLVIVAGAVALTNNPGASNANRINDGATLTMAGGTLLCGQLQAAGTDDVARLVVGLGYSMLRNAGAGTGAAGNTYYRFGTLARTKGATINFASGNSVDYLVANPPAPVNGIWGCFAFRNAGDWATVSAGLPSITYTNIPSAAAPDSIWTSTMYLQTTNHMTLTGSRSIAALKINTGSSTTLDLAGATLTVEQGGFISVNNGMAFITNGTLTAGANGGYELIFHSGASGRSFTIPSAITDNGANPVSVIRCGTSGATLNLCSPGNTYSGGTYLDSCQLSPYVNAAFGLGNVYLDGCGFITGPQYVTCTLTNNMFFRSSEAYIEGPGVGGTIMFSNSVVTAGDGITARIASGAINIYSTLTGNGGFKIGASGYGTLTIAGSAPNTYKGLTTHATCNHVNSGNVILAKPNGVNAIPGDYIFEVGDQHLGSLVLQLANSNQIADSAVLTFAGTANNNFGGIFRLYGNVETIAGLVASVGVYKAVVENNHPLVGGLATLILSNSAPAVYSYNGTIRDGSIRLLSLVKAGSGAQILAGSNSYTGLTTINGGKLLLNGFSTGSVFAVNSAGTLGGSGVICGVITNYGTITPGSSAGTLTAMTNLILAAGSSVLNYELGAPGSANNDGLSVNGNLRLDGIVNITDLGGFGAGTYTGIYYAGKLLDGPGLTIGSVPPGFDVSVKTDTANRIMFVVSTGFSAPFVAITNADFSVPQAVASATIGGTSVFCVGRISYDSRNGIGGPVLDAGSFAAAAAWSVTINNLVAGTNMVTVTGTNALGELSDPYVLITRAPQSSNPSDVADFVIALATANYSTITLGWSNGTIKVLACTNQNYTADLAQWFTLASEVTSPWVHQDASNYPVIFYRIVSGTYTSQYDVGKYTITLAPGLGGNPAYNWIAPPLELFSNTVNDVLGNQLNYDASSFDVLQAQIPIGGAQIDTYYVDGTWTDGNDEPLTRFATGQGYILVVDATHTAAKTVAFAGKVPAVAVTNMLIAPSGGNPAYNWIGAPTPARRAFFVNGLTNAVVTTETAQNFDVYQNQVMIGGAQKDWYYVAGLWDDGASGTPLQTPGMGGILVLDQNHTSAATNWFAPKTR